MAHRKGHKSYGGPGQKKMEEVAFVDLTPEDQAKRKAEAALHRQGIHDPKDQAERIKRSRRHAKMHRKQEDDDAFDDIFVKPVRDPIVKAGKYAKELLPTTKKEVAMELAPLLVGGGALKAAQLVGKAVQKAYKGKRVARQAQKAQAEKGLKNWYKAADKASAERKASARKAAAKKAKEQAARQLQIQTAKGRAMMGTWKEIYNKKTPKEAYQWLHDNVDEIERKAGLAYMLDDMRGRVPKKFFDRINHGFLHPNTLKEELRNLIKTLDD